MIYVNSGNTGNLLLDALPKDERAAITDRTRRIDVPAKKPLIDIGTRVDKVYFPISGMICLVSSMQDGSTVETASYGSEAIVGLPEALNAHARPSALTIGQVPAEALELDAEEFRQQMKQGGILVSAVNAYLAALFNLTAQNASCNRLHRSTERLARWLLITSDRVGSDQFDLTHEFMGQMLGARRATVSESAEELQQAGFIQYVRGKITILDRERLVDFACECYGAIEDRFKELRETYEGLSSN